MDLSYYSKTLHFILGYEKWISLVGSKYTMGHFNINEPYTSVDFIPDDPDNFTKETVFSPVLSPYTLKLVIALTDDLDDPYKALTDLDYDLLTEIDYNTESECTSDATFIDVLDDFSKFADGSHLIYTHDITNFVLKHSDSYAGIAADVDVSAEKLFRNGLYSAAEYLYFNVTPSIIYRYIDIYKEFYNLDLD